MENEEFNRKSRELRDKLQGLKHQRQSLREKLVCYPMDAWSRNAHLSVRRPFKVV